MKPENTQTIVSLVVIVLLTIHLSDDIVHGYEPASINNLTGVAILAVWLYATLALSGRRSGAVILIVGSFFAAMMPVLHLSGAGIREEVVKSGGGLFFISTLMALGVTGAVSFVLSIQALWRLKQSIWSFLLWVLITVVAGGALFGALAYFNS